MKQLGFTALLLAAIGLSACQSDLDGEIWPLVENCDLHQQTCQAEQGAATVSLNITPQPIPIAKPLQINAVLKGLTAEKLELDISGINMYMGYNRVQLHADSEQTGHYKGSSMLAFCTNEVMQWQLTLLAHQADGSVIQIPFKLETRNR